MVKSCPGGEFAGGTKVAALSRRIAEAKKLDGA